MERPTKYILFGSAGEHLAVPLHKVHEISSFVRTMPVPSSLYGESAHIQGTCNLRGHAVPIINLRKALGLVNARETTPTCILVIKTERVRPPHFIGIPVDSIYAIETVASDRISPASPTSETPLNGFLLGTIDRDDEAELVLDVDWLACLVELDDEREERAAMVRAVKDSRLTTH